MAVEINYVFTIQIVIKILILLKQEDKELSCKCPRIVANCSSSVSDWGGGRQETSFRLFKAAASTKHII
jgi:hypothetical protein